MKTIRSACLVLVMLTVAATCCAASGDAKTLLIGNGKKIVSH